MARTTGTTSLRDLVERGALHADEALELRRRNAPPIQGVLQADGTIQVGAVVYRSPSKAAREALGTGAADGWQRWRVPRLGSIRLVDVREGV